MKQNEMNNSDSQNISKVVRDFYEKYPYPGPVKSLDKYMNQSEDKMKSRADFHLYWPHKSFREDSSILIAGCGTSQAAKHAIKWPDAQVTGIDFSENSIDCTIELKKKYNLNNLQVHRLDIENVKDLNLTFDKIICTGVLHHLKDPDAGLRALRNVLNPEGAMQLMVYAPYGRAGIYMMQDFCRLLGIKATDTGISDLISLLKAIPPGHPLENLIRDAPDFIQDGSLADSLLNPCDRAYSVPQLFDFINKADLKFVRWIRQAPYSPYCGVISKFPQIKEFAKLSPEEQFAAVELFRGTMVRHSIIAYRDENSAGTEPVNFDNDNGKWTNFIPIRVPETICITDRLPEGAAAVLINRTHAYRDLILTIDPSEKQLYDAIDGFSNIGEIMEKIRNVPDSKSSLEISRNFFKRLWWYDQVVFDTSKS